MVLFFKKAYRRIARRRESFILGFHRVADLDLDPWGMAVTPANFEDQIHFIADRAGGQLDRSIFDRRKPQVFVTFDDGYSDNYTNALPILKKYGVSATFFLATDFIGGEKEFWWDRMERIFLWPGELPEFVTMEGMPVGLSLGNDALYSEEDFIGHRDWKAWTPPPTRRHTVYLELWKTLHHAAGRRERIMDELEQWAGVEAPPRPGYQPLNRNQIREMRANGMYFGAHTASHLSLKKRSRSEIFSEIASSKEDLEEIIDQPVTVFSYPHGHSNDEAQSVLAELGFEVACTSTRRALRRGTDPYLTPRIFAGDDSLRSIRSRLGKRKWYAIRN